MFSCRRITLSALFLLASCVSPSNIYPLLGEVEEIEKALEARIGIVVIDLKRERLWERNSQDRFPMVSTFKTLACAALLAKVDRGEEQLDRRVVFQHSDLVNYSPEMKGRVGPPGVTLGKACEATLATSDNTAANIVLDAIGGPGELTSFLRSIGDQHTRLDRYEPDLNEAAIGDERDTTTPAAMAATLKALLVDDEVLSVNARDQLKSWLMGNRVGDALLRAGVPQTWTIADRTGAGGNGTRAITAVMWPSELNPIIVAIYITETDASFEDRNQAIAQIGSAIASAVVK